MRMNIEIDDDLMKAAQEATGLDTEGAVVEAALKLIVRLRAQERIRDLRGTVQMTPPPFDQQPNQPPGR